MKKTMLIVLLAAAALSLAACRLDRSAGLQPGVPIANPAAPQSTPAGSALEQAAGAAGQGLGDLQSTLQSVDTSAGTGIDASALNQSLTDLQNAAQVTPEAPSPTDDTSLDQSLNSLYQSLLAEPTP